MCCSSCICYHMFSIVMPLGQDCSKSKFRCIRVQIEFLAEIDPCHYWCVDQCFLDEVKGKLLEEKNVMLGTMAGKEWLAQTQSERDRLLKEYRDHLKAYDKQKEEDMARIYDRYNKTSGFERIPFELLAMADARMRGGNFRAARNLCASVLSREPGGQECPPHDRFMRETERRFSAWPGHPSMAVDLSG